MWVIDDDRITNMLNEKPNSTIWKFATYIFIAHKNYCRYKKIPATVNIEEVELYVDEQLSTDHGRENLNKLMLDITAIVNGILGNDEKKIPVSEPVGEV
jgi:hypothetical protein